MSSISWSENQLKTINIDNCNLLVSASAGSGKTAVLIERILHKITSLENPTNINELLILTFTRDAASEMRERLQVSLEKAIKDARDCGDELLYNHLCKQMMLLPLSDITTIDGYCLKLIKQNFALLKLDSTINIADDVTVNQFRKKAYNTVIDEMLIDIYSDNNSDELLIHFLEMFGKSSSEGLASALFSFDEFISTIPNSKQWINRRGEELNKDAIIDSKWFDEYVDFLGEKLLVAADLVNVSININNDSNSVHDILKNELDLMQDILNMLREKKVSEAFYAIYGSSFATLRFPKGYDEYSKLQIKENRDKYKDIFKSLKEFVPPDIEHLLSEVDILKQYYNLFIEIYERYSHIYSELKITDNILTFADVECYAYALLYDENDDGTVVVSAFAKRLQELYKEVMIDEYQDINYLQEAILTAITKNGQENNYFMVGDLKQGIYGFRNSTPELFKHKLSTYSENHPNDNSLVLLDQNFRSRKEVIDGINSIFNFLMHKNIGGVDYQKSAQLSYGNVSYKLDEQSAPARVEYINVDLSPSDANIAFEDYDVLKKQKIEAESKAIAKIINEEIVCKNGLMVFDKSTGGVRPARYSDICILLRSPSTRAKTILDVFRCEDIPVFTENVGDYFDSNEILTITNLIKAINNPLDDYALVSTMRAPFFEFTVDDLAYIKTVDRDNSFYNAVVSTGKLPRKDSVVDKVAEFLKRMEIWTLQSKKMNLSDFIWYLLNDSGYYSYVLNFPNGNRMQANLRFLHSKAIQYEDNFSSSLYNFIKYIENIKVDDIKNKEANVVSNDDVVRIMSIHKSKGLEFPVVFVCSIDTNFNFKDLSAPLLFDSDLGIGFDIYDYDAKIKYPSYIKSVISSKVLEKFVDEEMRLLYVALTRAKEKLFLVAAGNKEVDYEKLKINKQMLESNANLKEYTLKSINNYNDWIKYAVVDSNVIGKRKFDLSDIYYPNVALDGLSKENAVIKEDSNSDFRKILQNQMSWEYSSTNIDNKRYSVTEIIKQSSINAEEEISSSEYLFDIEDRNQYNDDVIKPIKFDGEDSEKKNPLALGSMYHAVLQSIPFDIQKESIGDFVKKFSQNGSFSDDLIRTLDCGYIESLLSSDVARRVVESGEVYREKPFQCLIEYNQKAMFVQGIIDLCFVENGEFVIVDYKTTSYNKNKRDLIENHYKKQLSLYKKALEKCTGINVKETYIYFIYSKDLIEFDNL